LLVLAVVAVLAVVVLAATLGVVMLRDEDDPGGEDVTASGDDGEDDDATSGESSPTTTSGTAPEVDTTSAGDLSLDDLFGGLTDGATTADGGARSTAPGDEALTAALLTVEELPGTGWAEESPAPLEGLCGFSADAPVAAEEIAFGAGAAFEILGAFHGVERYADGAAASAALAAERSNVESCPDSQLDPIGLGVPLDATAAVVAVADLGIEVPSGCDEVVAWQIALGEDSGLIPISLTALVVTARCGDLLTTVQAHVPDAQTARSDEWIAAFRTGLAKAAPLAG
jgi:hypothetical protein